MSDDNPSILNHMSLGSDDLERAGQFYDAVLAPVGAKRIMTESYGISGGKVFPEFWVGPAFDGKATGPGNGTHVAFTAPDRAAVDAFYEAGLAAGGTCDGPPGERDYHPGYYAAFLRDPDGHKVEAVYIPWEPPAS